MVPVVEDPPEGKEEGCAVVISRSAAAAAGTTRFLDDVIACALSDLRFVSR